MKRIVAVLALSGMLAGAATAALPFVEDFEDGDAGWNTWPGALDHLFVNNSHNHTPAGAQSYWAPEAAPGGWASYYDFGATTDAVRADVYVFADNEQPDADDSRHMLQLTADVGFGVEYLQIGVLQDYAGGQNNYSVRTKYRDDNALGTVDTGIARKQINGWTKLSIEADAGAGGDVRFYVDDVLAYTGVGERQGNIGVIRLGVNFGNNYDNFWYDDVLVTPEPASLALLGLGGLALIRRRRS